MPHDLRTNNRTNQAATGDMQTTGGYDAEFDPPLDTKYICPVCLAALRGPLQTKCGHRFCKLCMQRIIGTRPHTRCPVDKTWLGVKSDIFEDVAFEREILSMTVKCSNADSGCVWRGDLRHLQAHCDTCPCAKLVCPNGCEELYLRGKSEEHLRVCSMQVLECIHCNETIIRRDEVRHQMLACPRFPIQCPECGNGGIIREEMSKHTDLIQGECPATVVPCTYQEIGCDAKIKRSELSAHHKGATADHMKLLMTQVTTQKALLQTQSISQTESSRTCHRLLSQMEEMKRSLIEKDRLLNQQVERISYLENTNHSGRLHWKIDLDAHSKGSSTTTRFLSPPFYTSRPGYKLRACLEIDGHATRNTTFTSLFIVLRPGEFDDRLHFPFNAKCGVTLFDQCENPHGRSDFVTSITCSNMPRAHEGDIRDQFRGRLRFMQTDDLINGCFCSGGMLFMQIDVDVSRSLKI